MRACLAIFCCSTLLDANGAVYLVKSLEDSGPGSLRQAIADANLSGGGTINFSNLPSAAPSKIILASELPMVASNIKLLGPGTEALTVSGSNAFRVFSFAPGTTSVLAGLTITEGAISNRNGAGVWNAGTLTISNCALLKNGVFKGEGGGIYNSGHLLLSECLISRNTVIGADAVYGPGMGPPLSISGSNGFGGGISARGGEVSIYDSIICSNATFAGRGLFQGSGGSAGGAGVFASGSKLTIARSSFFFNRSIGGVGASGSYGGGAGPGGVALGAGILSTNNNLTMKDCDISSNLAVGGSGNPGAGVGGGTGGSARGSGIFIEKGSAYLEGITLAWNRSLGRNGATAQKYGSGYGGNGEGGAIWVGNASVSVVNSTISGNLARGGDGGDGSFNPMSPGVVTGGGGDGAGGGVCIDNGELRIINSTIVNNKAERGYAGFTANYVSYPPLLNEKRFIYEAASEGKDLGGGIINRAASVTLFNTILAQNSAQQSLNGHGGFVSAGHNLIGDYQNMNMTGQIDADLKNVNPFLGPLQDNGGFTKTHHLLPYSPAIDAGSNSGAPVFDQRGIRRFQGSAIDIGSLERATRTQNLPGILNISDDSALLEGRAALLSVNASGDTQLAYQWEKNAIAIHGATNSSLSLENVQPRDAGSYRVTLSNATQKLLSEEIFVESRPFFVSSTFEWARAITASIGGIASDSLGNAVVAGAFRERVDFDGTRLTNASESSINMYMAKYDERGNLIWARQCGTAQTGYLTIKGMAIARSQSLHVIGSFSPKVVFGNIALSSAGQNDVFVAKSSPDGVIDWVQRLGGIQEDFAGGVAADSEGNCIIVGYFSGVGSFGSSRLISAGNGDIFVVSYDSQGNLRWAQRAGGNGHDIANRVAVDDNGISYVVGSFRDTATFGSDLILIGNTNASSAFLASYYGDGRLRWAKRLARSQDKVFANGVATDSSGHCYVVGSVMEAVVFENGTVATNAFVAQYAANGTLIWVRVYGGEYSGGWRDVIVDDKANCYVCGGFQFWNPTSPVLPISEGSQAVVAKFSSNGILQWSSTTGGHGYDGVTSIALNRDGRLFVAGYFDRHMEIAGKVLHEVSSSGASFISGLSIHHRLGIASTGGALPVRLSLDGEVDSLYSIETSDSLSHWTSFLTMTNTQGRHMISDALLGVSNRRFFRARQKW